MSKILITSIGAGSKKDNGYKKAKYKIDENVYEEEFIAIALHRHINFDKIFMVGTKKSIWDSVYKAFGGNNEEKEFELYEKQENGNLKLKNLAILEKLWDENGLTGSKTFLINYGLNDTELWNNFKVFISIANEIKDGDEIYLDITHSFRSLSLMSYIMVDFIKSLQQKTFTVEAIYYGMFDYIHDANNKEKIAPIANLKILFEINEWIKAINVFKNYGRADLISEHLESGSLSDESINKFFNRFSKGISIGNLASVKSFVEDMDKKIEKLNQVDFPIVKLIAPDLIDFVKRMQKRDMSAFQLEISQWFYENKNYALSYIALTESIISKVCELENISVEGKENREKAKDILHTNKKYKQLKDKYRNVNKIRNNIAHQLLDRKESYLNDISNLGKYIKEVKKIFVNLD